MQTLHNCGMITDIELLLIFCTSRPHILRLEFYQTFIQTLTQLFFGIWSSGFYALHTANTNSGKRLQQHALLNWSSLKYSVNKLCYHWLSPPGSWKIMHCGIFFHMCFYKVNVLMMTMWLMFPNSDRRLHHQYHHQYTSMFIAAFIRQTDGCERGSCIFCSALSSWQNKTHVLQYSWATKVVTLRNRSCPKTKGKQKHPPYT